MAIRVLLFLLVSLLVFHSFSISSFSSPPGRRDLLAYIPASKKENRKGGDPIPNCREIGSRIECAKNSKWCRWCRSEFLDDMCFGSSEAWRFPHEVFVARSRANVHQLKSQLHNLKRGTTSVTVYLQQVKLLADQLAAIDKHIEIPETQRLSEKH